MNKCPQASGVNQRSRVCNQQQVALNPPLPSPRVTPRLNTDAGAVPAVWTCVDVCVHGHKCDRGKRRRVRVEQREGCKLSSTAVSFAERCSTCSLTEPLMSGRASNMSLDQIYENTIKGDLRHQLHCCHLLTRNKPQFHSLHRPLPLITAKGLAFFLAASLPLLTCGLREAASTLCDLWVKAWR